MRFKDLSEVHVASVKFGRPDLFDRVVGGAIDRAVKELEEGRVLFPSDPEGIQQSA